MNLDTKVSKDIKGASFGCFIKGITDDGKILSSVVVFQDPFTPIMGKGENKIKDAGEYYKLYYDPTKDTFYLGDKIE